MDNLPKTWFDITANFEQKLIAEMKKTNTEYFAFQDANAGFFMFLTVARNKKEAWEKFGKSIQEKPEKLINGDMEIIELTKNQYQTLNQFRGSDQKAIELLESYKA